MSEEICAKLLTVPNRLDPFKYLVHVLSTAKKIDLSQKDSVDLLLPENAPAECSVNFKK